MTDGKWKALFLPFRKQLLTVPQSFWKVTWCRDPVITSSFQLPVCWLPKAAPLPCWCWKTRWRWCENLNGDACDSLSYLKYEKATAEYNIALPTPNSFTMLDWAANKRVLAVCSKRHTELNHEFKRSVLIGNIHYEHTSLIAIEKGTFFRKPNSPSKPSCYVCCPAVSITIEPKVHFSLSPMAPWSFSRWSRNLEYQENT